MIPSTFVDEGVLGTARHDVDPIDRRRRRDALLASLFGEEAAEITIGRFVVREPLGTGAMGRVYRAHDPRLERDVAIKVLHADSATSERRRTRMLREARALAQLEHPNVVSVYEVGESEQGIFIVMQHVRGPTLHEWIRLGPHPWPRVVELFVAAARGLEAAHSRELVHRDFKPSNVFISEDDGRVLVGDFGLARLGESRLGTEDGTPPAYDRSGPGTRTGAVVGTPAYMAPEQWTAGIVDERADQFAFGVSLFEALHGHRPDQDPPATTRRLPRWLRRVVQRTLALDRDDRFASMREVIDALARGQARRRRRSSAAVVMLGVAAVALAVATAQPEHAPCEVARERVDAVLDADAHERLQATLASAPGWSESGAALVERRLLEYAEQWRGSRRDACEATWVRHEQSAALLDRRMRCLDEGLTALESLLDAVSPHAPPPLSRVIDASNRLPPLDRCDDEAWLMAAVPPPRDPQVARARTRLEQQLVNAQVHGDLGDLDEAQARTEAIIEEAETLARPELLARALLQAAHLQRDRGEPPWPEPVLERALHEAQAAGDERLAIQALASLAHDVGYVQERVGEGRRWLAQARAVLRHVGDDDALEAWLHNEDGNLHLVEGRPHEAAAAYDHALARALAAHGPVHPRVAGLHGNRGNAALALGDHEVALEHYDAALEAWSAVVGPEHPQVATALIARGSALERLLRLPEAQRAYERARTIYEASQGPRSLDVGRTLGSVGNLQLAAGRPELAREHYRRGLEIFEEQLGPEHPLVASTLSNIGGSYYEQADCDHALPYLRRALELKRSAWGDDHPGLLGTLDALAMCHLEGPQPSDARAFVEEGLRIRRALHGEGNVKVAPSLSLRGQLEAARGDEAAAIASLEEVLARHAAAGSEPSDPTPLFSLAELLLATEPERARELAQRALEQWRVRHEPERADEIHRWLGDHAPAAATKSESR